MTDELKGLLISKAEELGWQVNIDANQDWEFGADTPAGEDFWFTVSGDNVVRGIFDYYQGFDTEEYVSMWLEAKANGVAGVPDARMLLENADAIEEMTEALYDALSEVERQYRKSA